MTLPSDGLQRSARAFMLRSVAEIEIANWLTTLEYAGELRERWARERQKNALRFLQRKNPYGYSGAIARRLGICRSWATVSAPVRPRSSTTRQDYLKTGQPKTPAPPPAPKEK
jgi:hypothetical protein